jgi:hypothetical protein
VEVDLGGAPKIAASTSPGFVETDFSCAAQQYFYEESKEDSEAGSGGFALVEEYVSPPVPWFTSDVR